MISSFNQAKVRAVTSVFKAANIRSVAVASDVPPQPIGDEETLTGAINRAENAREQYRQAIAIGLEGGVMYLQNQLYLNNWGALITPDGIRYTAAGARIRLPDSFIEEINAGTELSDLMQAYTKKANIRHHEGAIGIFTNLQLSRAEMFAQVVTLLKGQMEFGIVN